MEETQELIAEFLVECGENLETFENNLLGLEQDPKNQDIIDSMFRMIHSIKGASGFMAFKNLESLTHKAESVLDILREGKGDTTKSLISTFLNVCDAMKDMFGCIEENSNDGDNAYTEIITDLNNHEAGFKNGGSVATLEKEPEAVIPEEVVPEEATNASPEEAVAEESESQLDQAQIDALKELGVYNEEVDGATTTQAPEAETTVESSLDEAQIEALKSLGVYNENEETAKPVQDFSKAVENIKTLQPEEKIEEKKEVKAPAKTSSGPVKKKETIRVEVETLDKLVNLAGELVLVRNQLLELAKNDDSTIFSNSIASLNIVTGEIQRSLMSTRMQQISTVWSKMPRIVRDLSAQLDKQIEIVMHGETTELDKTIIEAITDPMTHIIRNCCDHGIEMPADRVANGKDAKGTIQLRAEHKGNWIHVDIIDDGKGIDPEVITRKALEKGLHTEEELAAMDNQQIVNIIFNPGFSTMDQASNISGRGVGMDVIKSNIKKIDGNVEMKSEKGQGTHLKLQLPLTLAIIPAVIVKIAGDRYAIPQNSVQEFVSVNKKSVEEFENIKGQRYTRLRGDILPLVFASEFFNLEQSNTEESEELNYVVINADGFCYGLVIDTVLDIIEIVVKPLSASNDFCYYAGATIMGDGKVAMILDAMKIGDDSKIEKRIIQDLNEKSSANDLYASNTNDLSLTFKLTDDQNYLLPLSKTSRIEEISKDQLEFRQTGIYAKFHNNIIRIIDIASLLRIPNARNIQASLENQDTLKVLYYEFGGKGIAVDIGNDQDLLKKALVIEESVGSEFIIGTTLIDDVVYEVLNIEDHLGTLIDSSSTIDNSPQTQSIEMSTSTVEEAQEMQLFEDLDSVVSFKINDLWLGVELDAVSEIVNIDDITPVPGSSTSVRGLINLRGDIMVTRDLVDVLNLDMPSLAEGETSSQKSLIIQGKTNKVCIQVGEVDDIINLKKTDFSTAPTNIPKDLLRYVKGVYNQGSQMLLLLDEKKMFTEAEVV